MELVDQRADASWLRVEYGVSERRVCGLMTMAVSSYRYRMKRSDEALRTRLMELAREKPRFGYRRLQVLLRRSGEHVNHKRLHRVYCEAGLAIRRKKRKHCVREGKRVGARTAALSPTPRIVRSPPDVKRVTQRRSCCRRNGRSSC